MRVISLTAAIVAGAGCAVSRSCPDGVRSESQVTRSREVVSLGLPGEDRLWEACVCDSRSCNTTSCVCQGSACRESLSDFELDGRTTNEMSALSYWDAAECADCRCIETSTISAPARCGPLGISVGSDGRCGCLAGEVCRGPDGMCVNGTWDDLECSGGACRFVKVPQQPLGLSFFSPAPIHTRIVWQMRACVRPCSRVYVDLRFRGRIRSRVPIEAIGLSRCPRRRRADRERSGLC